MPDSDSAAAMTPDRERKVPWGQFVGWMVLVAVATVAVLPYLNDVLRVTEKSVDSWTKGLSILLDRLQMSAIAVCTGMLIGPRVGLGQLRSAGPGNSWKSLTAVAVVSGLVMGVAIGISSPWLEPVLLPEQLPESYRHAEALAKGLAPWKTFLASFSAGVIEEILFRFGMLTALVLAGMKLFRRTEPTPGIFWGANVASAILFALLHLTNVISFDIPITAGTVAYVLIGNGPAGLVFGWLYIRRGLAAAMIAHFSADVALKTLLPLVTAAAR